MSVKDSFIYSRKYQIALWFIALLFISLGVYLTKIRFMDNEWLSRSGCLVVMLGIWSGLGVIVQERILSGQLRWRRRNAITKATANFEVDQNNSLELEQELKKIQQAFDQQSMELTQRLKLSLGVLEVSLLLTGTFLWGFGDLLVK